MTGLSEATLLRTTWWQKLDFPAPGGPANKMRLLFGTSCISARDIAILLT
jgi:hypothetical protein